MRNGTETWQHTVTLSHHAEGRKYRFNVHDQRSSKLAKIDAEYFNEKTQEWRKVRSENSRFALLAHYEATKGAA